MGTQSNRRWTREETLIVFNLYCSIPFNISRASHPEVQRFAALIDRTPASVNIKIGNFGSLDPKLRKHGIKGLRNASRMDKAVWDEVHNDWSLIEESDRLIAEREHELSIHSGGRERPQREASENIAVRKVRESQSFFRMMILSAYESKCCVTGIDIKPLLVASHIKPWAESDNSEKLNPQNGLSLNALHDRAFDRGLIGVTDDYAILVSSRVSQSGSDAVRDLFSKYSGQKMRMPSRFLPRADFLAWHRNNVFIE